MPTDLASSLKRERALAQASKPEQGASFTDRFCQCIAVRWRRERSRRARQSGHCALALAPTTSTERSAVGIGLEYAPGTTRHRVDRDLSGSEIGRGAGLCACAQQRHPRARLRHRAGERAHRCRGDQRRVGSHRARQQRLHDGLYGMHRDDPGRAPARSRRHHRSLSVHGRDDDDQFRLFQPGVAREARARLRRS